MGKSNQEDIAENLKHSHPMVKSLTKGTGETLIATYTASHLFAEKSKWTAWSSNSDFPWRYESMDCPMVVVLSKTKYNKRKDTGDSINGTRLRN